jgi:hypothetical protein
MAYKRHRRPHISRSRSGASLPVLVTGQHLSFDAQKVKSGSLRGMRYEVWHDPLQRQPFVGVVYSHYESEDGTKGEEAENIGTSTSAEGAQAKADAYIERLWRGETFGYSRRGRRGRRTHISHENPLAMGRTERNVLIGVGVVGAVALAYELFSKPAAAALPPIVVVTPSNPSPPVTPPSNGQPSQTATGSNFNTIGWNGDDGQQIAMNVGDMVSVDLPFPAGATGYSYSATGTALQGGTVVAAVTYMQLWTAGATGTSTVSFQPIDDDNNNVGDPVSFTATVS